MKKRNAIVLGVGIILLALILLPILIFGNSKENNYPVNVSIENGVAVPDKVTYDFDFKANENDEYKFYLDWWQDEEPAFITGMCIKDPDGETVFSGTAQMMSCDTVPQNLKSGKYKAELTFITDNETLTAFCKANDLEVSGEGFDFEGVVKDGSYKVDYRIDVEKANANYVAIGIFLGVMIGIGGLVIILALIKNGDDARSQYDERQQIARGKAYRAGFYTMGIAILVMFILEMAGVSLPIERSLTYFMIFVFGGLALIAVNIWNDSYYAMNENPIRFVVIFALIALFELMIGIRYVTTGQLIVNGILTFRAMSFVVVFMLLFVLVMTLIKRLKDKREEDA